MIQISHVKKKKSHEGKNPKDKTELQLSLFKTKMGWFGLLGISKQVVGLKIGYSSQEKVKQEFLKELEQNDFKNCDWYPELRIRLQDYTDGEQDDFLDVTVKFLHETAFQKKVRKRTRSIPYGQKNSYLEVAEMAGSPRAARAVGNVMRTNPVPLIMPCHRVVSSDGTLGGFSAPTGIQLKKKLLDLESGCNS